MTNHSHAKFDADPKSDLGYDFQKMEKVILRKNVLPDIIFSLLKSN